MGDGATFLYQTGEEYRNIFPFLDWKKIPGTTTQQDDDPLPVLTASGYRIESDFVGGVSNGDEGVAVLDYNRNGLTARKAWFMMDDMIICLGNGITSTRGREVTTGVNQVYLNGPVKIGQENEVFDAKESQELRDPVWILHDGLGYIFPLGGRLALNTGKVEGSWHWVASRYPDERIESSIFKLWFDHGINPKNENYAYILLPDANQAKIEELYKANPFELTNSKNIQQVLAKDGSMGAICFYEAGRSGLMGGVAVSEACLVLLKNREGKVELAISDPTQKLDQLVVEINGNYSGDQVEIRGSKSYVTIDLAKGQQAGNTVQVTLLK
jgi:chondroitin AC lyase